MREGLAIVPGAGADLRRKRGGLAGLFGFRAHSGAMPGPPTSARHAPALRGGLLALAAALLFGISTPLLQRLGSGVGAFGTAALLYADAALVGALMRRGATREARLRRSDLPRVCALAAFGAVAGPVALAWGLQRTSAGSASLMLALEALFTALFAWALYRESLDGRVRAAMLLLLAGAIALVLGEWGGGATGLGGLLAVLAATAAWGMDNSLSRALAERDPAQVVLAKATLGAAASTALAFAVGEGLPAPERIAGLLVLGAVGYGVSLRFYLLAQRAFGAARTGSVFAFAPFIGAAVAVGLGDRAAGWPLAVGGALMLCGVALHLAERHAHGHVHEAQEHEHAHRHDDGHHDHAHALPLVGEHSHRHRHAPMAHAHPHVPDVHHRHPH